MECNPERSDIVCNVESGDQTIRTRLVRSDTSEFTRSPLDGQLLLKQGLNKIILRIDAFRTGDDFNVSVHGLELIRPDIKKEYDSAVTRIRKKTKGDWFLNCRYGIFVTWTSQVFPRHGERKDYETAVRAFDVDGFVNQIARTGAGLVVFNTSHAEMYFPAPIRSLDHILPGRTSSRDLISDLANVLNKKGIKLFLYYHLGAVSDSQWTKASGFWETDERPFFKNWNAVIREIGERYGNQVSGYWFDDGAMNCYYRSPDWQTMYASAKAGNPDRLVGYNPWKLPSPTLFMNYYLGETNLDPSMHGQLKKQGKGIIQKGPFEGLYASSTFVTESEDWGHFKKENDIDEYKFRYSPRTLANMIIEFEQYGNIPLFNLEIYQPGQMSENSIHTFELAKELTPSFLTHQ